MILGFERVSPQMPAKNMFAVRVGSVQYGSWYSSCLKLDSPNGRKTNKSIGTGYTVKTPMLRLSRYSQSSVEWCMNMYGVYCIAAVWEETWHTPFSVNGRWMMVKAIVKVRLKTSYSSFHSYLYEWTRQAIHEKKLFFLFWCVAICVACQWEVCIIYFFLCGKWNHPTDTIQLNITKRLRDAANRIVGGLQSDRFKLETDRIITVAIGVCWSWKRARISFIFVKMKRSIISTLVIIFSVLSLSSKPANADSDTSEEDESSIVETESGRVRGRKNYTLYESKPYYEFKGIPYARAPVDELRFKVNYRTPRRNCWPHCYRLRFNCSHQGNLYPGWIFTMPSSSATNAINHSSSPVILLATRIACFWMCTFRLKNFHRRKVQVSLRSCFIFMVAVMW